MSQRSWQSALSQILATPKADTLPRVAIVGIGSEFNGDDAAGIELARRLAPLAGDSDALLVVDGGPAPENVTGLLRRYAPDLVVMVDAVVMDCPPGTIRWVDWEKASGLSASTHTLPLNCLARYLVDELGCEVALLGIQPGHALFDAPLSPPVDAAVNALADGLHQAIQ